MLSWAEAIESGRCIPPAMAMAELLMPTRTASTSAAGRRRWRFRPASSGACTDLQAAYHLNSTSATAQVRLHGTVPLFKLYILNGTEVFCGFYPVTKHTVTIDGQPVPMHDLMGKDTTLFHYAIDDDPASMASQYVEQARAWFDAVWHTVGRQP